MVAGEKPGRGGTTIGTASPVGVAGSVLIDRDTFTIGEAIQLIADALTPIPSGPLTKLFPQAAVPVHPSTLEEVNNKANRDRAFLTLQRLISTHEVAPLDHLNSPPMAWDESMEYRAVIQHRLTAEDFRRLCIAMRVRVHEKEAAVDPNPSAVEPIHATTDPTFRKWEKKDLDEMLQRRAAGASDSVIGRHFGVARQRISQLIGSKVANKAKAATAKRRR